MNEDIPLSKLWEKKTFKSELCRTLNNIVNDIEFIEKLAFDIMKNQYTIHEYLQ